MPASFFHATDILGQMRSSDYAKLAQLGDPETLLAQEITKSFLSYAGMIEGKTVALWGAHVAGVLSDEAYIWLVCSSLVDKYPFVFLRHSRKVLRSFAGEFKVIRGVVHVDFSKSVKWLEWLGFEIEPAEGEVRRFSRRL